MNKQSRGAGRLALMVMGCVLSLATQRASAEGTFACHVLTKDDRPGVYFIQTDEREQAREFALQAGVVAIGRREAAPVVEVVECIDFPGARFSDYSVQNYVEKLPM